MPQMLYARGRSDCPRRVFIATPVGDGKPCDVYTSSLAQSEMALHNAGIAMDYCLESHNCHVDDARNSLVRQFMRTDCESLIFIDADVGWEVDELVRLAQYDRDIIAGIYPKKQDEVGFPINPKAGELRAELDGALEVQRVPTGFLRIRRHVLERLMELEEPRAFSGQEDGPGEPKYYPIFERSFRGGKRWSGDYEFCNKAAAAGFKIYIDPLMTFAHAGSKIWSGSLGKHWRKINGIASPEFAEAIDRLRAGDASPETFVALDAGWDNHFSASPMGLAACYFLAKEARGPILETGSGLTSLVLGIAAETSGVPVHSLESDLAYFDQTKAALKRHNINTVVVHHAPIVEHRSGARWYAETYLPDTFSLVLCDGPVRKFSRAGLFEFMRHSIVDAAIVVDDMDDPAIAAIFSEWCEKNGRIHEIMGDPRRFAISAPKRVARAA